METTPFLQPGFLLTAALALIGFISWLVKLERRNAVLEKDNVRLEKEIEKQKSEIENQLKDVRNEFKTHAQNGDIHFNLKISEQVEKNTNLKFHNVDTDLKNIREQMKQGFDDIKKTLEKLTQKQ